MAPPRGLRSAVPMRRPRRRRARRQVGVATLLTGMAVGVIGGMAAGAVLLPSGVPLPGEPVPETVAGPEPGPDEAPSDDVAEAPATAPTALPDDDALATGDALTSLTPPPDILSAPPAVPEPLEPLEPVAPLVDDGLTAADRAAGLLSLETPTSADGELVVVPGAEPAPAPDRPVKTIRVEVEAGLPIDGARFAETVMTTLNDPRGWGADGSVSFARTDGEADLRVVLASPDKIDEMCAPLKTVGTYSCGRYGHAALNHTRWVTTTDEFAEATVYRQYLVNHEVGHLLGNPHEECPGAGELAPLMQQQTVGVAPCVPNPWPHPTP